MLFTSNPRGAEDSAPVGAAENGSPRRLAAYTNRYTNLGVMGRNATICCEHYSL
jgi:hypothetical protein